ncbi:MULTISPECIES: cytochrome c [unclassified Olleya]|uniref:c-type cytochrome n=1 Tax=unclassified Olleya TaxID=2615019 RepID=UPI0025E85F40|nr:cytochrome c [Olleya sp. UBA1516]|tara:strand:+ start:3149 stop:3640 length:492 start_codon:yes stop_codon:yes gene_type:complete
MSKLNLIIVVLGFVLISCGGNEKKAKDNFSYKRPPSSKVESNPEQNTASSTVDLTNKGIGPIKTLTLPDQIDTKMVSLGKEVYDKMCTACHRSDKKFIGPAPKDILKRRTPEWVMNMILNPEEMLKNDPIAKDLLKEYNNTPMINQGLTEADARAVLEYFRTL